MAGFITRSEGRKFLKLGIGTTEGISAITRPNEAVSLYVHIPFCRNLCPFCCFNRYLFEEDTTRAYFKVLKKELDYYIAHGFSFSDCYIGGGTPTVLLDELTGFIAYVRQNFDIKRLSVETTPSEINGDAINSLYVSGVNRLSVGVQSFKDRLSDLMGRLFISGEQVREKLLETQGKFQTVNVDLLFDLPHQTVADLRADIKIVVGLGIDQITFNPLMPFPHKNGEVTRRFNRIDTSCEKKMYDVIMEEMDAAGYQASTAWCFSKGSRMIDEYIVDSDDYIGIGSGAVSIINGNFFVNSFSLEKYKALVESGKLPVIGAKKLSTSEYLRYFLLSKMFGLNVDEAKLQRRFNGDFKRELDKDLFFLKLSGILKGRDELTVTPNGMYTVSVMMREFFGSLNGLREYCIANQI